MTNRHWEYDVMRLPAFDLAQLDKHLGDRGRDGWEAFAVVADGLNHQVYLKRELTNQTSD